MSKAMKLEYLKPILYSDDLEAVRQRLAYAKELLLTYGQPGVWKNIEAFIEKLTAEGL